MLDRELSYQMPFKRLLKLSRMATRRAFGLSWLLTVLLFVVYVALFAIVIVFDRPINAWLSQYGLPGFAPMAAIIAGFFLAFWWLRRRGLKQSKERADYDSVVRFREEADGLWFATPEIEYRVKWHGISQMMLIEGDGLVFSHGNLFFMVPNEAFRDTGERDALARDTFARLSAAARERSETFNRPVLDASANTAGT